MRRQLLEDSYSEKPFIDNRKPIFNRLDKSKRMTHFLNELGLVDQDFNMNPVEFANSTPTFVTAFSSNHQSEGVALCRSILSYKYFPHRPTRLIVYDLGDLTDQFKFKFLTEECPISEFRVFQFWRYPAFVSKIMHYRWKPIIIAEVLKDEPMVMWLDSSIIFNNTVELKMEEIIQNVALDPRRLKFALFGWSSHSIYAATHPIMYLYLNVTHEQAIANKMFDGGHQLWFSTLDSKRRLLRPYVECALIDQCMAPPGSRTWCRFSQTDRDGVYGMCHRFDQSAISIVAAVESGFDPSRYRFDGAPTIPIRTA